MCNRLLAGSRQVPNRMVCLRGARAWFSLVALVGKAEKRKKKRGASGVREASEDTTLALGSEELGSSQLQWQPWKSLEDLECSENPSVSHM